MLVMELEAKVIKRDVRQAELKVEKVNKGSEHRNVSYQLYRLL